ncbi:protein Wnt-7b-like isoform X2 [Brevipalpus obovatus]|uniref:protein Wnt-7b-like isoform X2 n=1 Tax=Brevipalpus obovatus TaxID=246614 RepID=UPI003D9F3056
MFGMLASRLSFFQCISSQLVSPDRPAAARCVSLSLLMVFILLVSTTIVTSSDQSRSPISPFILSILSSPTKSVRSVRIAEICERTDGLTKDQLDVCQKNPEIISAVAHGARQGIAECQNRFSNDRWNCSFEGERNNLSNVLRIGSRETAFFYAMVSSGVVHTLAHACGQGTMMDCSCEREKIASKYGWKWGGCSDNVKYAMKIAKLFVDSPEKAMLRKTGDISAIMNLHNNRAGRLTVKNRMVKKCRCHGVSGTCGLKTCWHSLPTLHSIGEALKRAIKVRRRVRALEVGREDLVHIQKSPDYCVRDPSRGILGTSGRRCNNTSEGPDGCSTLCCERGYDTQMITQTSQCNCQFVWCCEVKCSTCETVEEVHTCL